MDALIIDMFLNNEELLHGAVLNFSWIFIEEIPLLADGYGEIYNIGRAKIYDSYNGLSVGLVA